MGASLREHVNISVAAEKHLLSCFPREDTAKYSYPGAVIPTWLQVEGPRPQYLLDRAQSMHAGARHLHPRPNYLYGMGRLRILNIQPNVDCIFICSECLPVCQF